MDILWALRLKNVETLQHYLQEISTQITMFDLSPAAKVSIGAFADFFPFCLVHLQALSGLSAARSYMFTAAGLFLEMDEHHCSALLFCIYGCAFCIYEV